MWRLASSAVASPGRGRRYIRLSAEAPWGCRLLRCSNSLLMSSDQRRGAVPGHGSTGRQL